jgi:hypothetical protein
METLIKTSLEERVNELNNMILQGQILEAFDKFYAEDVTMQENEDEPTVGKVANRLNEEAFVNNITEFRGAAVKNVIVSDDITVVEWGFDFTHSVWGVRTYAQVTVQRWNGEGQIVNEKFYYNH